MEAGGFRAGNRVGNPPISGEIGRWLWWPFALCPVIRRPRASAHWPGIERGWRTWGDGNYGAGKRGALYRRVLANVVRFLGELRSLLNDIAGDFEEAERFAWYILVRPPAHFEHS